MPTFELNPQMMREIIMDHYSNPRHTISTASTDIVCEQCIGKDYKDSLYMIEQYLKMIDEKEYDDSVLDEAIVFMNTGKQAARIHCATMGWTALKEMLEDLEKKEN